MCNEFHSVILHFTLIIKEFHFKSLQNNTTATVVYPVFHLHYTTNVLLAESPVSLSNNAALTKENASVSESHSICM